MRDPARIAKIIGLLHKYWGRNPDLRLGQLIINLTPDRFTRSVGEPYMVTDPFHVEDTEWEEILRNAIEEEE